ncbi:hypothetical protein [Nocardioides sp. BYT-33-1]|uniref:hypothetical protein n=1 Tax=Nocardioides sp. BYT-33-1 TaxID=3416952 RepID=UPI003F53AAD3
MIEFGRRRLGIEKKLATGAGDREEVLGRIKGRQRPIELFNERKPAFTTPNRMPGGRHARQHSPG